MLPVQEQSDKDQSDSEWEQGGIISRPVTFDLLYRQSHDFLAHLRLNGGKFRSSFSPTTLGVWLLIG